MATPTNLSVTNITATSARFNWEAGAAAFEYEVFAASGTWDWTAAGQPAKELLSTAVPEPDGSWTAAFAEGREYSTTYFATGCQPVCAGPYG
jgi:hypothetical protein